MSDERSQARGRVARNLELAKSLLGREGWLEVDRILRPEDPENPSPGLRVRIRVVNAWSGGASMTEADELMVEGIDATSDGTAWVKAAWVETRSRGSVMTQPGRRCSLGSGPARPTSAWPSGSSRSRFSSKGSNLALGGGRRIRPAALPLSGGVATERKLRSSGRAFRPPPSSSSAPPA